MAKLTRMIEQRAALIEQHQHAICFDMTPARPYVLESLLRQICVLNEAIQAARQEEPCADSAR